MATTALTDTANPVLDASAAKSLGFTDGATELLRESVVRFSNAAGDRAVNLAEMDKQDNFPREVTTQHVKTAVDQLSGPLHRKPKPRWYIAAISAEYIFTLIAGAGAGHLDDTRGVAALLIGGLLTILIIALRHIYVERDR